VPGRAGCLRRRLALRRVAIPSDGGLAQVLGPGRQPLGGPDVVEELYGSEGIDVRLGEAPCQLCALGLGGEADALPLPLDILGRPAGHQLTEEVVNAPRTHGPCKPGGAGLIGRATG
jgi:hypothetical protein